MTKFSVIVLMAGGRGTRLDPLTDDCPKPLLPVGGKPILERIVEDFVAYGFHHFFISVNHQADKIKEHFGDGSKWGAEIQYLEETECLGTAGSLALIPDMLYLQNPVYVMNGDVLVANLDFRGILNRHLDRGAHATVCVVNKGVSVPFGVVEIGLQVGQEVVTRIREKPTEEFLISAGIYILDPDVLFLLPDNGRYEMPDLLHLAIAAKMHVIPYYITGQWKDVGIVDELDAANIQLNTGKDRQDAIG